MLPDKQGDFYAFVDDVFEDINQTLDYCCPSDRASDKEQEVGPSGKIVYDAIEDGICSEPFGGWKRLLRVFVVVLAYSA